MGVKMSNQGKTDYTQRFEELTFPYLNVIYRTAYYLTRTTDEAEDLTQETYLKAYRAFDNLPGQNVKAWLFAIVRNSYLDLYRRQQRCPVLLDLDILEAASDYQDQAVAAWVASAEEQLLAELPDETVHRALASLPEEWRLVILLADVEDFSYQEIADIAQIPIGTVMSRLHRGRKRLYQQLRSYAHTRGYITKEYR
jgi:RNA polymerase sigma-70 factor (ECF subfamily)